MTETKAESQNYPYSTLPPLALSLDAHQYVLSVLRFNLLPLLLFFSVLCLSPVKRPRARCHLTEATLRLCPLGLDRPPDTIHQFSLPFSML